MINFILYLIVGGLAGWIASKIMGTDAQQGVLMNVVVGIVGAFVGGLLFGWLAGDGISTDDPFSIMGVLVSIAGACVVLFLWKLVTGRKSTV